MRGDDDTESLTDELVEGVEVAIDHSHHQRRVARLTRRRLDVDHLLHVIVPAIMMTSQYILVVYG